VIAVIADIAVIGMSQFGGLFSLETSYPGPMTAMSAMTRDLGDFVIFWQFWHFWQSHVLPFWPRRFSPRYLQLRFAGGLSGLPACWQ